MEHRTKAGRGVCVNSEMEISTQEVTGRATGRKQPTTSGREDGEPQGAGLSRGRG